MIRIFLYLTILILFISCSIFRQTTKTTDKETLATKARTDFNSLTLKTANRETNIFTVWDSGLVYQHQNILESVKLGEATSGKTAFVQKENKENFAIKTQPPGLWMYAGTAVLLIGAILVYRKFR